MRYIYSLLWVIFISSTSCGQTFSLPDLIKLSKMNVDDFDTYVTSKGFVFERADECDNHDRVSYVLNLDISNSWASKSIEFYKRYINGRYHIRYYTRDKKEYLNIKNQLKTLGFKLQDSRISTNKGEVSGLFYFGKGKSEIELIDHTKFFQISYLVKY